MEIPVQCAHRVDSNVCTPIYRSCTFNVLHIVRISADHRKSKTDIILESVQAVEAKLERIYSEQLKVRLKQTIVVGQESHSN